MSKKETVKFITQLIVSIASAILTALGATSLVGILIIFPKNLSQMDFYMYLCILLSVKD